MRIRTSLHRYFSEIMCILITFKYERYDWFVFQPLGNCGALCLHLSLAQILMYLKNDSVTHSLMWLSQTSILDAPSNDS